MLVRPIYRILFLACALALAALLSGCMSVAESPQLQRSIYPGLANLDERAIASMVRQRLRAIAKSHGRTASGRRPARSARWARKKVCCSASSPSSRLESMWRQNASSDA